MKNKAGALIKSIIKHKVSYLLMAPFLLVFGVFSIFPVAQSIFISFTSFNVFQRPEFIGLTNYIRLFFFDDVFLVALQNTIYFALITGPIGYLLCLFFAWVVNELGRKMGTIMTVIFYAPSIAGNAFVIWLLVFDGDIYGYLNSALMNWGIINAPILWLRDPRFMMPIVILVQLWISLGTSFLTLRAGFATIDRQYYEAGAMDGIRNRWQELWFISLPIMTPHLMLSALLSITAAFGAFHVAMTMTGFPSQNYETHLVVHHLLDFATIRHERGYGAAIAVVLFVLSVSVNKLCQRFIRRIGK